jgi:hypothetical protein
MKFWLVVWAVIFLFSRVAAADQTPEHIQQLVAPIQECAR